ncbi:hypothetical protein CK203_056697 [Vitis vinifera]|uniref:Uncharacterized protein n=1 Tax=Vitis vinifera TaxID=29760 RepID=A0A438GDW3_VITVI|nr:hypothetical protein CK203_056697 [Vitis vinifera]
MTPEMIIKRPMLTQPPIEGNLDCRARPFHSELCFDVATFRLQPQLRDSFHLLRRYHMDQLLTPRDFFYPRRHCAFPTSQLGQRIIESGTNPSPSDIVRILSRGHPQPVSTEEGAPS